MKDIKNYLLHYKKQSIELIELEKKCSNFETYKAFARYIESLVENEVLKPVSRSGTNGKSLPLYNKYKINKQVLKKDKTTIINQKIRVTTSVLSLEAYFDLPLETYNADLPYIDKIDTYLRENALPVGRFLPELSFELTGDEKWIDKGGQGILRRLGLWERLSIKKKPDPLAFAINPNCINKTCHKHLIVENKTAYLYLMKHIAASMFSTVIYGQGWKITASMPMFNQQFSLGQNHTFYYFGDIDKTGIAIYNTLNENFNVKLAKDFYRRMFDKKRFEGKVNQTCPEEMIISFVETLKIDSKDKSSAYILSMLSGGYYQPQEILSEHELVRVLSNVRL